MVFLPSHFSSKRSPRIIFLGAIEKLLYIYIYIYIKQFWVKQAMLWSSVVIGVYVCIYVCMFLCEDAQKEQRAGRKQS